MAERIGILNHHIDSLAPFLKGRAASKVESIVVNKIIPSMEDIEFGGGFNPYEFLQDPIKRQKYAEALIQAGIAFVTGNFDTIPDWDENFEANFDFICKSCGNFINNKCAINTTFDKGTSGLPQDNTS